ncbi:MAG: IreB family regulatory phosphoprotein [Clostridia bacterium]|nr:IreB family regulatory phosphoprotein [Clostridia bacterium]
MIDNTINFSVNKQANDKIESVMREVYAALVEKGYNPINQLVGYIQSGDPTYITSYNDARTKIRSVDRDDLLEALLKSYLGVK